MTEPQPAPAPVLKAGAIYSGDNGQRICLQCAGASAKFTGFDRSGLKVRKMTKRDALAWQEHFGKPLACECGKTVFKLD